MTDTQPTHDIDPRLKKLLELIRPVPGRNPQAVARGRARFHAEMEAAFPSRKLLKPQAIFPHKNTSQPRLFIPAFAIRAAAALAIVMALLFGGAGITAMAAQDALPGETLYPVKTGLEDMQISLTFSHMQQVELHLAFAEHRINELAALIEAGETTELALTTARFELEINLAAAALRDLFAKDPAQAAELAPKLTAMLTHYAEMLADIKSDAPETAQRDMEHAQLTTQIFSHLSGQTASIFEFTGVVEDISDTAWIVNGLTITIDAATEISGEITIGDVVIIHVLPNPDNTLTAHEIKLAASEENSEDGSADELENDEQNSNSNKNNAENEELGEDPGHEQEQEMEQESEQGSMDEAAAGSIYRPGDEIDLIGTVEVISDTLFVVDGLKIVLTDETKLEETFEVGDLVRIRFIPQEDGTLIAISISPATSTDDDSQYHYNQPGSSSDDEDASESDHEGKPGSGR